MKILLIDDDTSLLTIFETALKTEGFEVATAFDGKSGIEKVKLEKPNLVFIDQILPDMNGNDIVKSLKADEQTKNIPLAILSNFGQNELVQEALSHGALDYILKYQIAPQDLINKAKDLLKDSQGTPPAAPGVPTQ